MKLKDRRLSTSLPRDLKKRLADEAGRRVVDQKQIIVSALEEFLSPEERDNELILRRLSRIDSRQRDLDSKLELLAETVGLFVQVWFANTDEVPEPLKTAAAEQGERRFSRFLEALGKRIAQEDNSPETELRANSSTAAGVVERSREP